MRRKILNPGKIENATPDDLDDILEIERGGSPNPWKRSFFESEFSEKLSTILVLKEDSNGKTSGFIVFRTIGDIIEINNLAVGEARRRSGIAAALLSRLKDIAGREKIKVIFLEVRSENQPAIKLYEKAGFVLSGRRKNYYTHPNDDALVYKFDIT